MLVVMDGRQRIRSVFISTKIEAANTAKYAMSPVILQEPKHDCPETLLREQQNIMGQYLHILEVRAEIEGIELK